jgi:hypothetical protein
MDVTTRYPITPTGKVETNILAIHDYLNTISYTQYLSGYPDLWRHYFLDNSLRVDLSFCER